MGFLQWIQLRSVAYVVYSLALIAMAALLGVIIAKLFVVGSKSDKLDYLKNYKKGQFAIIYLIAIPLYFFGYIKANEIASGTDVLLQLLNAVTASVNLLILDFRTGDIVIALSDKFYYATLIVCYILTAINVLLFSASLLWQRFINFCKKVRAYFSNDLYVVVGYNEHNLILAYSLKQKKDKRARLIILAKTDAGIRDELFLNGVCYYNFDISNASEEEFCKKMKSLFGIRYFFAKVIKKNITVIVNTEDDERNLLFLRAITNLLQEKINSPISKTLIDVPIISKTALLMAYIFSEEESQSTFNQFVSQSKGHINLLNYFEQIAFDFADEYPLTRYMTDKHIDYDRALIRNDVDINVCLVGFGSTNRQVFLKTVANSQFFTEADGKLVHKKVHYYAFDKEATYNNRNINQSYFRYSREFYKKYQEYKQQMLTKEKNECNAEWDYLPLPDYPADDWYNPECNEELSSVDEYFKEHFCGIDISSYEFYDKLRGIIEKKNSYNYIIISFGGDMENIDLARKIFAKLEMWGDTKDTHIFAKVNGGALIDSGKAVIGDEIKLFGSTESVYNVSKIVNNKLREMAFIKSFKYSRADGGSLDERRGKAVTSWMGKALYEKSGNFYSCLNLKVKLNLLGLDYVKDDGKGGDINEFYLKYFGTDKRERVGNLRFIFNKVKVNDDEVYTYDPEIFKDGSVRTLFAIQEHQRWNADYICKGVVPPNKKEIAEGRGKDMEKRLIHQNLTTFDGLEQYRTIATGETTSVDKYKEEVRHYDYRIMDYADLILADAGYKIVKK